MAIINPDYTWDSVRSRPVADAVEAAFKNFDQIFALLNQRNPPVMPNLIQDSGTDEFSFMMSEI